MYAIYGVPFTINILPMLAYIPYMDPMGMNIIKLKVGNVWQFGPDMFDATGGG